jgi:hypothetical protein
MSPDTLLTALPMAMSHNWYQRANCTEFLGDFPTVSTKTNIRLVHQTKFIRALKQRPRINLVWAGDQLRPIVNLKKFRIKINSTSMLIVEQIIYL